MSVLFDFRKLFIELREEIYSGKFTCPVDMFLSINTFETGDLN
jgi:hypothetical protein